MLARNAQGASSARGTMIDASVGVWYVLPALARIDVLARVEAWIEAATPLSAPALWRPEVVSGVRSAVFGGQLRQDLAVIAVGALIDLNVALLPLDDELCRAALDWAARLHQRRAYDAFYVAAAEREGLELWTADQRLAHAARIAGASWVRWIGE